MMTSEFKHISVLLKETTESLDIKPGGLYIDCTTGGGGHSLAIAEKGGRLICFDADLSAVAAAETKLADYVKDGRVRFVNANFGRLSDYVNEQADGILMDLGVSSHQLDTAERGFSFREDAPLDMRLNPADGVSAYDIVNGYPADRLTEILFEYGEEKYARRIVQAVIAARNAAPIETTAQLAELVRCNVPLSVRNAKNPCRKTFQAIRIEVNDELGNLERGLESGFRLLKTGGRLAVITFHSLEDRMVKRKFAELTAGCDCPRNLPLCVCGKSPQAEAVTRKPIVPSESELQSNRRARSAKLRVAEKL
jgi:16S rRNA (cytosine1402-N4)-methyltransferase